MKNDLKVSIITPSYNQGKYIKQCIDSVLEQKYPFLEHIIIDGGSTDETLSILKSYGNKIKWVSEKDKGQTDAINKGLKMASGNIMSFLCTDDFYSKGAIKKVVNCFNKNPSVGIVSGDYKIIDENGKEIQSYIIKYKRFLRLFSSYNLLSIVNYIIEPSTFWRKSVYKNIGQFDEDLSYTMDYDYWMKAYINKIKFEFIKTPLSCFRIHKASKGGSRFVEQFKEELIVQKKYNKNCLIYLMHCFHNKIIIIFYKFIK